MATRCNKPFLEQMCKSRAAYRAVDQKIQRTSTGGEIYRKLSFFPWIFDGFSLHPQGLRKLPCEPVTKPTQLDGTGIMVRSLESMERWNRCCMLREQLVINKYNIHIDGWIDRDRDRDRDREID
jgi:hypothetical protein